MIEHPEVIQTMRTGYPSNEYSEFERDQELQEGSHTKRYEDFQDFFLKEV